LGTNLLPFHPGSREFLFSINRKKSVVLDCNDVVIKSSYHK
jgi:hypothetical protein